MKKTVLLVFALAALAFTGCNKDEVIEPVPTTDSRLLGDWLFMQVDHPDGTSSISMVTWNFKENTIGTPDTVLNYTAHDYELIIGGSDKFTYSFPSEGLNMLDEYGNNLRFRR